jgi:hypothetical protein
MDTGFGAGISYGGCAPGPPLALIRGLPTCQECLLRPHIQGYNSNLSYSYDCYSRVLFCSSVLNLAELLALRPDLQSLKKVIYFHENQLVYPVQKQQHRDFQYGYNQILSRLYVPFAYSICDDFL